MSDEMLRRFDEMSLEEQRAVAEEYVGFLVDGVVMGAASHGIILASAEVRAAYDGSTADEPFQGRLHALILKRAAEQGRAMVGPLGMVSDG